MPGRRHLHFDDEGGQAQDGQLKSSQEHSRKRRKLSEQLPSETPAGASERTVKARNEQSTGRLQGPRSTFHRPDPQARNATSKDDHGMRLRERARVLLKSREKLPIWDQKQAIRQALQNQDVMLLVGETGSGKSTQVPQFLLNEDWCKQKIVEIAGETSVQKVKIGGCIAITQPRRVAAISLARRVAEEVGTPLGSSSPASTVGYNVRFDNSTSPNTKIKFLTEGMLLQEMLRDPWLRQYSAVVVDEVHERNVNVDLILGFLRKMLTGKKESRGGMPLKVAVMSATADLGGLISFFEEGYAGFNRSAEQDVDGPKRSSNDYVDEQKSATASVEGTTKDSIFKQPHNVSICRIEGRQFPVKVLYSPSPVHDIVDAALKVIFQINFKEPLPGDILVFLTGQETVESLEKLVNEYAPGLTKDVPKLRTLPLFAALPQAAQQQVFQPAPYRTRKVIIATNIAETSVTVPGVRHVIDCGKSKLKHFRSQLGLESLLCKPISKSAAIQRKGRAGREAPGTCYRLYTEDAYEKLDDANTPEILRCDIVQALLTMKARGIERPWEFPLLDPPPRESMEKGLVELFQLGALTEHGDISQLGHQIARLPLSAPLGRVMLASAEPEMDCLAEVIDIISCLSVEAIFQQPTSDEGREKAANARSALFRRAGDHLTLLAAMQAYTVEQTDRKAWCEKHLISHRAMRGAWDVRKQLREQARIMGFGDLLDERGSNDAPSPPVSSEDRAEVVLKCFLCGFGWKTALLCPDGTYRTIVGKHEIAIHPSSVLFGRKVEGIMYNEFVFTNRSYARGVSAVQANWLSQAMHQPGK